MSVIEDGRRAAQAGRVVHPLVRALCVEDVHVVVEDGDQLRTSRRDGVDFVHVHSTRDGAEADRATRTGTTEVRAVRLPPWLLTLAPGTGVRLDPGSPGEVVLDAALVRLLVATGAGTPTPSALTPTADERLVPGTGPAATTELDRAVRARVTGRLRRCEVSLDGVGGTDWPVYVVDGDGRAPQEVADAVGEAAGRPVVVLVDGQPAWVAELVGPAVERALELPAGA